MKPMKFEFVVFGISHENAVFLWNIIVKVLQSLGFDVTGDVHKLNNPNDVPEDVIDWLEKGKYWYDPSLPEEVATSNEEYKRMLEEYPSEDLLGGVDWSDPASYYSNEDEHEDDDWLGCTDQDE